jgi:cytoskeletal protein RodZ
MKEIGAKLRAAREAKNISLEEIQLETKIRLRYLEAIESGAWEIIPGEVYRRGFVCSYASMVGLDGEELMREYHQTQTAQGQESDTKARNHRPVVEPEANQPVPVTAPEVIPSRRIRLNWLRMLVSLGTVFVIIGVVYLLIGVFLKNKPVATETKSAIVPQRNQATARQAESTQQVTPVKTEQPAATLTVQQLYPAPLTVYAEFSERVWVQVTTDGKVKYLDDGATFSDKSPKQLWTANHEMKIRVGNSGGLRLTFNGKELGVIGEHDQPRTVIITAKGVEIL